MRINKSKEVDPSVLRTLFTYNPTTGELFWSVDRSKRVKAGDLAGTINSKGYRVVSIKRVIFLAHRVIWAMCYGEWPPNYVDHKDGDITNNRLKNLRQCLQQGNMRNRRKNSKSFSNYKGVTRYNKSDKFRAQVTFNKVPKVLGVFSSEWEAAEAYNTFAREHYGEFALLNEKRV